MTRVFQFDKTKQLCWFIGAVTASASLLLAGSSAVQAQSGVNRFQTLVKADELYKKGETQAAENLYRQVKPAFPPSEKPRQAIYDAKQLPGDAQVYLRLAKEGLQQNLVTKIFLPLRNLTQNYPEFIEGHILLANACRGNGTACQQTAKDGQPKNSIEVLSRATELYPDEPELLKAKIKVLQGAEEFLEAAITARQFVAIYPDYEEAPEFTRLAEENMQRYQSRLHQQLNTQGILTAVLGVVQGFVTKDWNAGLSGFETLAMLAQGESKFGKAFAGKQLKQYEEQDKVLQDPQVLNYVKGIAGRLTPLMGRNFEYEFQIIKDDSLNAYALPGGKIFINTGAILRTNSEAELAGLISHEISHSVLSHGFHGVAQSQLVRGLSQVVPIPNLVKEMVEKEYSREQERQADILGTRVLSKAGYAADGLRNLMVTLKQQDGSQSTSWQSTHPAPSERISYLENLIQRNNYNRYAFEGVKTHREIQQIIRGVSPTQETPAPQPTNAPQKKPATARVKLGNIALSSAQTRENVEVRIDGARIDSPRDFTIKLIIENRSSSSFGFVPLYAQVVNESGKKLTARFESANSLVPSGGQIQVNVRVLGHNWKQDSSQNLTVVIKESTSGARMFRVPF